MSAVAQLRCVPALSSLTSLSSGCVVDIYDEFVKKATELASQRKVGNPLQPGSEQGPIVSKVQFDKVMNYIKAGQDEGAVVNTGESAITHFAVYLQK